MLEVIRDSKSSETAGYYNQTLSHSYNQGWPFLAGDPEYWRFEDQLVVPGGRVLDLGIQVGGGSMFFALHGMQVDGYENMPDVADFMRDIALDYQLPIRVVEEDVEQADLGRNQYDVAVMRQLFVHFPSTQRVIAVLDKAWDSLKRGGHMYVRAAGKDDDGFAELASYAGLYPEITRLNEDAYQAPCSCSGEYKIEPQLFLGQTALMEYMVRKGAKIIHSQLAPQYGAPNIMYGEDWQKVCPPSSYSKVHGMVTIIAQKKAA